MKYVVYSDSHRQSVDKIIHKSTKDIVTVPENCMIIYNCGLYHGQRKSARKDNCKDLRMSFQLVNDSLFNE